MSRLLHTLLSRLLPTLLSRLLHSGVGSRVSIRALSCIALVALESLRVLLLSGHALGSAGSFPYELLLCALFGLRTRASGLELSAQFVYAPTFFQVLAPVF